MADLFLSSFSQWLLGRFQFLTGFWPEVSYMSSHMSFSMGYWLPSVPASKAKPWEAIRRPVFYFSLCHLNDEISSCFPTFSWLEGNQDPAHTQSEGVTQGLKGSLKDQFWRLPSIKLRCFFSQRVVFKRPLRRVSMLLIWQKESLEYLGSHSKLGLSQIAIEFWANLR